MYELNKYNLNDALFIDIETTRGVKTINVDSQLFEAWKYDRSKELGWDNDDASFVEAYYNKAALYAEYGKITCISVGRITKDNKQLVLKSYYGSDENELLLNFVEDIKVIEKAKPKVYFAGHAVTDFDMPFLSKRLIINGIDIPSSMDYSGLKPWEVNILDTKTIWRMTGIYTQSLLSIVTALGIDSPKDDISGKEAAQLPYTDDEGVYERIARYCEKDVLAVAQIVRKIRKEPELEKTSLTPDAEDRLDIVQYLLDGGEYTEEVKGKICEFLDGLSKKEQESTFIVLNSICSTAKGKVTHITKKDVTELKKKYK